MKRALAFLALAACAGGAPPQRYPIAEAGRSTTEWLTKEADGGKADALRALGRIGDDAAIAKLKAVLASATSEATRVAAVEGLWYADTGAPEIAAAYGKAGLLLDVAVVRSLGRLATDAELALLEKALADPRPEVRAAAGVAAGVAGRRKIPFTAGLRAALTKNLAESELAVLHGAVYGLAYDPEPQGSDELVERLTAALQGAAETRALAIRALGLRGASEEVLARGLDDVDVYVSVESVRALSAPKASAEMRAALAAWLDARWSRGADGAALHPLLEGLARLAPHTDERSVADVFRHIRDAVPHATRLSADAVQCRAAAGLVRHGASLDILSRCGGSPTEGWPVWARRQLLAEAVKEGAGTPAERKAALSALSSDRDERVRAAVPEAAAALLPDPDAEKALRAALADPSVAVAENACDAVGGLGDKAPSWAAAALLAVAPRAEKEPELRQSLLDALASVKADAADVFQKALADPSPAVRKKAAEGLKKLGKEPGAVAPAKLPSPPIELDSASAGRVLIVSTTQGTFHVELAPDAAPWNVATLLTLAQRHFFDGTFWHRVVPGFVVQGGDPTGTGAGGPGFSVVAEPSSLPYVRGAVGIADAGKDTGGSQWFVMHAAAPHLDGRYTVVGKVPEADMPVVDKLIVGDRILRIEIGR